MSAISIRDWLKMLGSLNVAAMSVDEGEVRMAALVPALAMQFSADTFTYASAVAVAAECEHFPTFGEIVKLLRAWRRNRDQPFGLAIEGPSGQAVERREPYVVTSTPDWCGKRARLFDRRINEPDDLDARRHNTQPPLRTVDEQLAILRAARATGRVAVDEGVDA